MGRASPRRWGESSVAQRPYCIIDRLRRVRRRRWPRGRPLLARQRAPRRA